VDFYLPLRRDRSDHRDEVDEFDLTVLGDSPHPKLTAPLTHGMSFPRECGHPTSRTKSRAERMSPAPDPPRPEPPRPEPRAYTGPTPPDPTSKRRYATADPKPKTKRLKSPSLQLVALVLYFSIKSVSELIKRHPDRRRLN
jgi:hypothetical protein